MIKVPQYTALELETGDTVKGYFYAENGHWMNDDIPDLNKPVVRYYIVDEDGRHREIAENTLQAA